MTVSDTAFRATDDSLTAGNLLQNDGIVTIVERDNNNFETVVALAENVATDMIAELPEISSDENLYEGPAIVNDPF